jgi:hypothetical protein
MSDRIDELMRSLHEKPRVADQSLIENKLQAMRTPPTPKAIKPRDGKNGIDGVDGAAGADGTSGIDGKAGADGADGRNGIDGVDGMNGLDGAVGEQGEAGMVWRGTYRDDIEYWIGDVVGVSGSAYVCVAATNQAPPVGFGWELLVSRGAQGIRGIKGDAAVAGAADAGTLTGDTLASNVLASSLTSVGTLSALTVTATIAGSINGNAATATTATTATSATSAGTATTAGTVTTAAQPTITSVGTLTGLTSSGQINCTLATTSTSTTTGAIKTAGGMGIGKAVFIGQGITAAGNADFGGDFFIAGIFSSTNTTDSTSPITGSTIIAGGVGISKDLFVNGKVDLGASALISAPTATALAIQSVVPAGTGITPTVQLICPSAALALTSGATAQNAFSVLGAISVQAATTYMFDGFYLIKTTGATTHTISMSFALTTATITNCTWTTMAYPLASTPTSAVRAQDGNFFADVAGGLVNATNATAFNIVKFEGIMRVNAAGTVTPQITFSAAPGGTNTMEIGSYLRFYPIGSNTVNAIGTAIS